MIAFHYLGSSLFQVGNLHLALKCWSSIYKMREQLLLKITFKLEVSLFELNTLQLNNYF
jgi:hypothetical protein